MILDTGPFCFGFISFLLSPVSALSLRWRAGEALEKTCPATSLITATRSLGWRTRRSSWSHWVGSPGLGTLLDFRELLCTTAQSSDQANLKLSLGVLGSARWGVAEAAAIVSAPWVSLRPPCASSAFALAGPFPGPGGTQLEDGFCVLVRSCWKDEGPRGKSTVRGLAVLRPAHPGLPEPLNPPLLI